MLNAANEIAVATFLAGRIRVSGHCEALVEIALQENESSAPQSIEDVYEIDREVRTSVTAMIEERCA